MSLAMFIFVFCVAGGISSGDENKTKKIRAGTVVSKIREQILYG